MQIYNIFDSYENACFAEEYGLLEDTEWHVCPIAKML